MTVPGRKEAKSRRTVLCREVNTIDVPVYKISASRGGAVSSFLKALQWDPAVLDGDPLRWDTPVIEGSQGLR